MRDYREQIATYPGKHEWQHSRVLPTTLSESVQHSIPSSSRATRHHFTRHELRTPRLTPATLLAAAMLLLLSHLMCSTIRSRFDHWPYGGVRRCSLISSCSQPFTQLLSPFLVASFVLHLALLGFGASSSVGGKPGAWQGCVQRSHVHADKARFHKHLGSMFRKGMLV